MKRSKYEPVSTGCLFHGLRLADGETRVICDVGNTGVNVLPEYKNLVDHSDGFEWGYGGSGPAQLAFALLYNVTNDEEVSLEYYQRFKFDFISRLPMKEDWKTTDRKIAIWLDEKIEEDKETALPRK